MNEGAKTAVFAGIAVLLGCVWLVARPKEEKFIPKAEVGKDLFEAFTDATQAASLTILTYNEELAEIHEFKVAKNAKTGAWTIPSHSDYPADAEDRIRDVATSFIGVKKLGIATEDAAEHALFGVVEPSKDSTKMGDKGVGLLIRFEDQKGKELASLVIGKQIKGADGHRFVRIPRQDIVYDVEIDPARFSTKFEDWIEEDLLDISTMDIAGVQVKDYSVLRTTTGFAIEPRFDATANWNSSESEWELEEFNTYRKTNGPDTLKPIPSELVEGEELNDDKLNELKNALDDLKIVDVRRKPQGLRANLQADSSLLSDQESVNSLVSRGFYPLAVGGSEPEIFSANGELHAYMKDGYELVLRFGNIAGTQEDDESKLNRYLFVTALVNESKFPKPELQEVPKKPESAGAPPPPPAGAEGDAAETEKAEKADEGAAADKPEEKSELEKEIERIEKENQRKLDEWKDNREKAVQKVREMNARFTDWYYVVSEDVYKKIRLSRGDLIKEGEKAADEGFGVDAFRKLQSEGLQEEDASDSQP